MEPLSATAGALIETSYETTISGLSNHSVFKDPQKPTTPELIKLAETGAEAWARWRRRYPARDFNVDLTPVYAHLLGDPKNPSPEALHGLAFGGRELWDAWRKDHPDFHPSLESVWSRIVVDAENPTREALVRLALSGAEIWNAWRQVHQLVKADFSEQDFRELEISFAGLRFGHYANFADAKFGEHVSFQCAVFGDVATFERAEFMSYANFVGASFGNDARFLLARFWIGTSFAGADFGDNADFVCARFRYATHFDAALFGNGANFTGTSWELWAKFRGTQFGENATFIGLNRSLGPPLWPNLEFNGAHFGDGARFDCSNFRDFSCRAWSGTRVTHQSEQIYRALRDRLPASIVDGRLQARQERFPAMPAERDKLGSISFAGCTFAGIADFSNRTFTGATDFGKSAENETPVMCIKDGKPDIERVEAKKGEPTRFLKAPNFHGCILHQDTDFGAPDFTDVFTDIESRGAERAYRTLKLAMSKHQATREEQLFFKLEMKAEAHALRWGRRYLRWGLFWLYQKFADYGFSVGRPFLGFVGSCLIFFCCMRFCIHHSHPKIPRGCRMECMLRNWCATPWPRCRSPGWKEPLSPSKGISFPPPTNGRFCPLSSSCTNLRCCCSCS